MDARATARIRGFGTSIFTEMSRLAVQHGAVNLGQGFPDFAGPDFVKEAAKAAIDADLNQYAPSPRHAAPAPGDRRRLGAPLRPGDRPRHRGHRHQRRDRDASSTRSRPSLGPGDEVIVFEPFYDSYLPSAVLAGGALTVVTLRPPDWSFDPDELRGRVRAADARLLLLNTPHNPTGKVFSRAELAEIAALCQEHDVVAITDEVYDRIIFDDAEHVPAGDAARACGSGR